MTPNELYAIPGKKIRADLYEAELILGVDLPECDSRKNTRIYSQRICEAHLLIDDLPYELVTWWYEGEPFLIHVYTEDGNDQTAVDAFCTNPKVLREAQNYMVSLPLPEAEVVAPPTEISADTSLTKLTTYSSSKLFKFVKKQKAKKS